MDSPAEGVMPRPFGLPRAKGTVVPLEVQLIKQGIFKQESEFEGALFHCFLPSLEKDVYINTFQVERDNS